MSVAKALSYQHDALFAGEIWRFYTGHLTHYSFTQLSVDTGLVLLFGLLLRPYLKAVPIAMAMMISMTVISLVLLSVPEVNDYRGAGGVAAMLWVMVCCNYIVAGRFSSTIFWSGCLLLLLLFGWVVAEVFGWMDIFSVAEALSASWQVLLCGTVVGFVLFFIRQTLCGTDEAM